MSQSNYDRFIDKLKTARTPIARAELAAALQLSEKTIGRYVNQLIDSGVEVVSSAIEQRMHYQIKNAKQLPGEWFHSAGVKAFGLMLELIEQLGYSAVSGELAPLKANLNQLMKRAVGVSDLGGKLVIKALAQRPVDSHVMSELTRAVVAGLRVNVVYRARSNSETSTRELSPAHIELYRNNWYLIAWCHKASAWRYFALERLERVEMSSQAATPGTALPSQRGYGIFDLTAQHTAHLRFSVFRAQWVSDEIWHPNQIDTTLPNGQLERKFPYGESIELIRDLMREGADVEILGPEALRSAVLAGHKKAIDRH